MNSFSSLYTTSFFSWSPVDKGLKTPLECNLPFSSVFLFFVLSFIYLFIFSSVGR